MGEHDPKLVAPPKRSNRDPRSLGCRCDECPLGDWLRERGTWFPVLPEEPDIPPKLVLIGEEPGPQEVRYGRPMIGGSGQLLERTINRMGLRRDEVLLDNALLCQPPGNNLDRFINEIIARKNESIRARNKGKKRADREPMLLKPQVACQPHVTRSVEIATQAGVPVVALGKLAYWAITGRSSKVAKIRGSFGEYDRISTGPKAGKLTERDPESTELPIRVTATVNPAYALRNAPYKEVLHRDIERAWRWHNDRLDWDDPAKTLISTKPTAEFLTQWLSVPGMYTWDLESTGEGELLNKLRTFGIYSVDRKEGVIVPWVSINGKVGFAQGLTMRAPFITDKLEAERIGGIPWWDDFEEYHYEVGQGVGIQNALWNWMEDPACWKVGHYSGYFDIAVVHRHLGPVHGRSLIDQILLSRIWNSDLPRSLYFVGTMLTDVPAWKAAEDDRKIAHDPRTYDELALYNHTDNVVVAKTSNLLIKVAKDQWDLVQLDHGVESVCREMHHMGLYVDEVTRAEVEAETRGKLEAERKTVIDIAGAGFNPRSGKQMGKLLYEDWGIPIPLLSDSGKPSVSSDAIRILLTTLGLLNDEQRILLEALWRSRTWQKDLSDVLLPLRRRSRGGIVFDDGVMRPDYGAHIPSTGRISSANKNTQNIRKILRKIIKPRPGNLFIISDYDQVELRLMSAAAQVKMYLDEFGKPNSDPHAVTATLIYGKTFTQELEILHNTKVKTQLYTALRKFAKNFVYAMLYGGGAETVYETVSKAVDPDTGDLLFPNMGFRQVKAATTAWMRNTPEVPIWWEQIWAFAEEFGYVQEPIMGRRRHMPVMLRNEAINHPIQGGAGIIMSQGMLRVREHFVPDYERGVGIVNQMHDALTLEVPEERAHEYAQIVTHELTAEYPVQLPGIRFTTLAEVFRDWAESEKVAA